MTEITEPKPSALPDQASGKLPVGKATSAIWRAFRSRPWPFIGLSLLPIPASFASSLLGSTIGGLAGRHAVIPAVIVTTLAQYAFQFACQNAAIYGGARLISGTSFTAGEALEFGFRRLLAVLGAFALAFVIVLIGLVLLIIPGLIAMIAVSLAIPACVIENQGPVNAIKRSVALTKGNMWRVVGVFLNSVFLPFFAVVLVGAIVGGILAKLHLTALIFLLIPVALIVFIVIAAISPIVLAVVFVELRAIKEGIAPGATVASVFD